MTIKMLAVVGMRTRIPPRELLNRPHFAGDKDWQVAKWVTESDPKQKDGDCAAGRLSRKEARRQEGGASQKPGHYLDRDLIVRAAHREQPACRKPSCNRLPA